MTKKESLVDSQPQEEDFDLTPGRTMAIPRADLITQEAVTGTESEESLITFLKTLASDSNIEGLALASMRYGGGIYSDFFVRDVIDKTKMRETLKVTDASFKLLEDALGRPTGHSSYTNLGDKPFEEVENKFRRTWDTMHPEYDPFDVQAPRTGKMELMGIIRFT